MTSKTKDPNEMLKIEGDYLVSKRFDSKEKLQNNFKKNEEYLKNSGLIDHENMASNQVLNKKNQEISENEKRKE